MDSVLIVVLNWNGLDDTEDCLKSLAEQTYLNYKIALVDNGSTEENTLERLKALQKKYGDKLALLQNQNNLGFAGGVNTGIRYGLENSFTYIALFNNDATAEPEWLEQLVKSSNSKKSALTTGLLLHEDGSTIDSTGDFYTSWGLPFPRMRGELTNKAPKAGRVFGGSGGATLYRTELFKDIGLFDETFFAYYEDVDISFRALLAGYTAYYEPQAVAYHKQGASSSKIPGFTVKQTMKNLPLLFIKNVPNSMLLSIGIRFWVAYMLIFGKALLGGNFKPAFIGFVQGFWLFWMHAIPERIQIQKRKSVTDSEIKTLLVHDLPPDQTGLRKLFGKSVK